MKITYTLLCCAMGSLCMDTLAAPLPAEKGLVWQTTVFGQSTDVNFATNVLPDKIGTNQVTLPDGKMMPVGPLKTPFSIESRGGKIGNSHDGLTYYYTRIPASANALLEAEITVDQFGPENEALPAGQEGAGLLIRDIVGAPRLETVKPGYEELPASSNMVMNAIMTQDKKDKHRLQMTMISRNGAVNPWGNPGIEIKREGYQPEVDIHKTPTFRLRLARTDQGFTAAWAMKGSDQWVTKMVGDPHRVTRQDPEGYYIGFFASRNARITVENAQLQLSEAHLPKAEPFVAKPLPVQVEIGSPSISTTDVYIFQLRSNEAGKLTLKKDGSVMATDREVIAGEMTALNVPMAQPASQLTYHFKARSGKIISDTLHITKAHYANVLSLYAAPDGKAENNGSKEQPLDIKTAIQALAPGGTLWLADGDYAFTQIPASASGTLSAVKKLRPAGKKAVFHGLNLDASFWDIQGISVTEKSFIITGSHNRITRVVAHHADDTGIVVTSPSSVERPLWASYNLISHSESYANQDRGKINADGFAVKMRVGEGNRLRACFSHDNIDDGFDLFNKVEDGPNGRVIIENSIALRNVNNGFKLGGEGLPVAHEISGSLAIENGMDGFTDNFNPGALKVIHNTAIDNQRFNYIFRPGLNVTAEQQGVFEDNLSLRSKPGKYPDAVVGRVAKNNEFLTDAEQ